MSQKEESMRSEAGTLSEKPKRRHYEPPCILLREQLESVAIGGCGKGSPGTCGFGGSKPPPINS